MCFQAFICNNALLLSLLLFNCLIALKSCGKIILRAELCFQLGHEGLIGFVLQGNSVFVLSLSLSLSFLFFFLTVMISNNQDWPKLHPETDAVHRLETQSGQQILRFQNRVIKRAKHTKKYCSDLRTLGWPKDDEKPSGLAKDDGTCLFQNPCYIRSVGVKYTITFCLFLHHYLSFFLHSFFLFF